MPWLLLLLLLALESPAAAAAAEPLSGGSGINDVTQLLPGPRDTKEPQESRS
jgi:hypothetical protein